MEKFKEAVFRWKQMKGLGDYRLCWVPFHDGNGRGLYSVIEFFGEELHRIDKNKIQIVAL